MYEIAKVPLDNELDLILAHKRTMKLAELAGLSLASQTTFATAVSEVARDAIAHGIGASLVLGVTAGRERQMIARIKDQRLNESGTVNEGINFAKRLVDDYEVADMERGSQITLFVRFPTNKRVSDARIEVWKEQFDDNLAISPYEEIRRKNRQLQELAERLRDSEEQYQLLTDSLPLLIFTVSSDGKLLYANNWVKEYTRATVEELNETDGQTVMHPDDLIANTREWKQALAKAVPYRTEARIKNAATGAYLWHLVSLTPLKDTNGEVLYWTGFLVDIHAQKMVEQTLKDNEELKETKQKLEKYQQELQINIGELNRSNQELAEFAYVASHDLQEPLRKIQSFSTLLVEQFANELSPTAKDLMQRMHSAAERMHGLIKDLLAYSRLNTQQQPFKPVNLNVLVKEVLNDLEVVIREKGAEIDVDPLPTIHGNALQLRQLFQNLLSNALKFTMPDRSPVVQVKIQEAVGSSIKTAIRHRENTYLAISVQDNGIGFDEKYHDRIFQLFQRLHGKGQYAGTGIGLTICKKVAEMHGGTIAAQGQPGHGAAFTIYLPESVVDRK